MTVLDDLSGREFGPFGVDVSPDRITQFLDATGDDPLRWADHAPPMFANAVLFSVAPAFLGDPSITAYTRSLIHSEQSFTWHRPLAAGEKLTVRGLVAGVRARGPLNLVTFEMEAASDAGPWLEGESVFLMSDQAAAEADDEPEPPVGDRPDPGSNEPLEVPGTGEPLAELPCGASRLDLIRYAAATRDWNPIHLDHRSAREAGLGGTIVHGLLMAAWMGRALARYSARPDPLGSLSLRFRKPLRPGVAAAVAGTVLAIDDDGVDVDLALEAEGERLVTGKARVTP